MYETGPDSWPQLLEFIKNQATTGDLRITGHAHAEMVEEGVLLEDVLEALSGGQVLEYYPEHKRGGCCLLSGRTIAGRHLHIVCTTDRPVLIVITVYEPKPPKWLSPVERRPKI